MNAKENARRIIRFEAAEWVMMDPPIHRVTYLGCDHEGYTGGGHHLPVGSRWTDIWGTEWRREHEGVMGFPRGNPLADLPAALPGYRWPDPDDERICRQIGETASGWERDQAFLCGVHRDTLWEKAYMLVGMEALMCYFHTEADAVRELLHRIMDFQLGMARHYLDLGVEMVATGDDLGTQRGLLLSPRIVQDFLVPEYRRLFELYKERGVLIMHHSCGHILPLLSTFMALGVDILNPLQVTANDLGEVRRVTQGRMALYGGISSALVVSGPPEAIRREAAWRMWQLGREGGYFCGPDQGLPWPQAHYDALAGAVTEYGRYPLREVGPGE
jgi:uroporphyrinogen decarboxylase